MDTLSPELFVTETLVDNQRLYELPQRINALLSSAGKYNPAKGHLPTYGYEIAEGEQYADLQAIADSMAIPEAAMKFDQ